MCVECYGLHRILDLKLDIACSLIGPWFGGLEVEEGDRIVGRFYAGHDQISLVIANENCRRCNLLVRKDVAVRCHLG